MKLLEKFREVAELRRGLGEIDPTSVVVEGLNSATEGIVNGRPTILAGTNNYLGLTFDEQGIAAGRAALSEAGTGTTGSRMANGTYAGHRALEAELADFYGYPSAVVFSTGYAANLGSLAALLGPDDAVLLDADAHASLFDGCRLCPAKVFTFRHNDPASLDRRLGRLGEQAGRTLVVIEGLYGVLGDRAPIAEIVEIKARHGACLFVDEAHSFGVLGEKGLGLAEEAGVLDDVDFIMGTFSKSLGTTGGFCVSRHEELALFPYRSRPYMFTASPSPAVVECTRSALRAIRTRPELRARLWRNATRLREGLTQLGLQVGDTPSPVLAIRLGDRAGALAAWNGMLREGVYVNLMLPPAAPAGSSLLRMSVSAAHTDAQIDEIVRVTRRVVVESPELT
ncbi:MAG: aminotransferase class I/II-fold pyridoxal phosphate-dependent enzyme [Gammaproteobacteria bacterium]|nr:aminotransferase class I/II-fold pyridoxal phosphate-dependent enzyme [Gammaproteobacteria bacterium]